MSLNERRRRLLIFLILCLVVVGVFILVVGRSNKAEAALGTCPKCGNAYTRATCTTAGKCGHCSYTESALGHSYNYTGHNSVTHTKTCSRCNDTVTEPHSMHTTAQGTPATCTTAGKTMEQRCSCGYVTGGTTIAKLGHSYNYAGHNSVTHTKTCSRCNDTVTESHSMHTTVLGTPATCTTTGKTMEQRCSCGYVTGGTTIPKLGHDMKTSSAAVAATCTKEGKTETKKCSRCSYTEGGATIPKKNHNYSSKTVTDTYKKSNATCTSPAVYYYKCETCTAKGTDTYESGNKLNHSFKSKTTTDAYKKSDATCTSPAVYYYKCETCTAKGTDTYESGNKLDHKFTSKTTTDAYKKSDATCTSPAVYYYKCETCTAKGTATYESGSALGHDMKTSEAAVAATCTTEGKTETKKCSRCNVTTGGEVIPKKAHSYTSKTTTSTYLKSAATCTSPAVYYYKCATCNAKGTATYESGKALGHEYSVIEKDSTYHWKKCSRCSEINSSSKEAHKYGTDGKCTVCGSVKLDGPCNHDFSVTKHDNEHHWKVCSKCGDEQPNSRTAHTYGEDGKCECGAIKSTTDDNNNSGDNNNGNGNNGDNNNGNNNGGNDNNGSNNNGGNNNGNDNNGNNNSGNNNGNNGNNSNGNNGGKDDTTSNGKLPQTGETLLLTGITIAITAIAGVSYFKIKKYKNI